MKKILLIILSAVIALSMTACNVSTQSSENVDSGNDIQTESSENGSNSQEISSIERSEDITDTSADENLLLDANILSGYLALCLDTNTTPETPKFNYAQFLIKCAVEGQKDFCYYNRFFRVNEQNGNYRFDYDTVKKLICQVFNDGEWVDNWFKDAETSGENYSKEDNSIIMPTEVGGVWFYYAGDFIYSEFSADNTQVISHLELFAPDASSGDPGHKSLGNYNIVFDICTENGEQFLRFNRFALVENEQNSTDNSNTDNIKQLEADILLAVENIGQAHSLYYGNFISGDMIDGDKILSKDKSPYPDSNYYAHLPEYDTVEELKALACRYFSEEVFENSFMSEFEPKHEGIPPYLVEVDGTIYNNLSYGTGGKAIFMPETAKVTAVNGNNATVTLQYYNAMDEALKETTTVDMVYENGKWVFNQAFLLKQYE